MFRKLTLMAPFFSSVFSAPLDPNPITDLDKFVNKLRIQYRTINNEFHVTDVSVT